MIRNPEVAEREQRRYDRMHPLTFLQKLAIWNALYEHARKLGHFQPENALEGIETDIHVARIINGHGRTTSSIEESLSK
ncbi:MAG: hypothetical protein HY708_04255 [Ignavibacteriae bacterium]|nr:hypothetical protein [Ignavibacteriota bacterium]